MKLEGKYVHCIRFRT